MEEQINKPQPKKKIITRAAVCSVVVRAKLSCGLRDCEQFRWFTLVFRISLFFLGGGVGYKYHAAGFNLNHGKRW